MAHSSNSGDGVFQCDLKLKIMTRETSIWAADRYYEPLLEVATPELYRQNSFRILALPINVTMPEVERRRKKMDMAAKLGLASPEQGHGYLPIKPAPDQDCVRTAIERLRNPQKRLIDEFFWFWELTADSPEDKALELLSRRNIDEALNVWEEKEEEGCYISTHNIAIFYHLTALDMEEKSTEGSLAEDKLEKCQSFWEGTLSRWQKLLKEVNFWDFLTKRIRDFNDPRLTSQTAKSFYETLPKALLLVNAKLAVQAALKGDENNAKRHIELVKRFQFEDRLVNATLQEAASPVCQRIKMLCAPVAEKAEDDPEDANQIAHNFLNEIKPSLKAIDVLLPRGSAISESVHDEIAETVRVCTIAFGNETGDWNECLSLTQEILPLAASTPLRNHVKGDIEFIKKNIEIEKANAIFNTCFFCGKYPADSESLAEVGMYGDVKRKQTFTGTKTTYSKRIVPVPRCAKCKEFHDRSSNITLVGGIIGAAIVAVICLAAWGADGICAAIGLGFLGFIVGCFIVRTVADWNLPRDIKPESHGSSFFLVKELKSQGWEVGDSP